MWRAQDAWADTDANKPTESDPFDLPTLDGLPHAPTAAEFAPFSDHTDAHDMHASVHSDEFMDAEAFMAEHRPGEDSFLREAREGDASAGAGDWSDDDDEGGGGALATRERRRASAIFVPKSRNMDKVEFSSPKRGPRKSLVVHHETPIKTKLRASLANGAVNHGAFSTTTTAVSSECEIHMDDRSILTPNSFKHLQSHHRDRPPIDDFSLSHNEESTSEATDENHSWRARQIVDANAHAVSIIPEIKIPSSRPSSAEKAMHAGPGIIRKALHELESLIEPPDFESEDSDREPDPTLEKLQMRLREVPLPVGLSELADEGNSAHKTSSSSDVRMPGPDREFSDSHGVKSEGVHADRSLVADTGMQTDPSDDAFNHRRRQAPKQQPHHLLFDDNEYAASVQPPGTTHIAVQRGELSGRDVEPATKSVPKPVRTDAASAPLNDNRVDHPCAWQARDNEQDDQADDQWNAKPARPIEDRRGTSFQSEALRQSLDAAARKAVVPERNDVDDDRLSSQHPTHSAPMRNTDIATQKNDLRSRPAVRAKVAGLPLAAAVPSQMARRCRRFLCTLGERMSEQIVFSNSSTTIGRICVSLLPLSTGCQQFSVSPAVLELQPRSSSSFLVTFDASREGVVAGIFQFRAVGIDGLFEPYEVLIEASVRGDLQLPPPPPQTKAPRAPSRVIKSTPEPSRVTELPARSLAGVQITPTFLRFSRPSGGGDEHIVIEASSIRVTNTTDESLKFQIKSAHEHLRIKPSRGSIPAGSEIKIQVQPLCRPFGVGAQVSGDWCGSMTVVVGDLLSREVSVVTDKSALAVLPSFDEVARLRQAISKQTDSFYYTKKVNRRGLYFHARAVECGRCIVGESHQVPVYICNGSDAPMTVFLQALQDPFACTYQPTTLQPRKFIEVPVTFTPKATGKVATCLVAYTVSGKAAVTLIARGVDKSASTTLVKS